MNKIIRMKLLKLIFFTLFNIPLILAQNINNDIVEDSLSRISLEEVLLIGIRAKEDVPVTLQIFLKKKLHPGT